MEIVFLTVDEVLELHRRSIKQYGGASGVLSLGMIESAVAVPRQAFGGHLLHTTVHEVAAAYLFHLVSNHGFEDGNKRVGTFAALTFLNMNGYKLTATGTELEALVRGVAAGRCGKSAVIAFFATCTAPRLD